ncbi:hypothetical protein [Iningainema tapete]|uniref:Uncharacterized protein n=1 Tax=Iningainema tapete BLCC-T55 TaxID=2748662 RepID=A0A8J6XHG8_9CYAN|nr:hypothetical protein [Iningainema tapete]MBD2775959.1 hypothetical protein [Iningainema tapete BLCC-T55]
MSSDIAFGEQGFFSATVPNAPSPLLTVNPSALLFNQIANPIQVNQATLSVNDGRSLSLLGGNVNLDGGKLQAANGQIDLAGVATGRIELEVNNLLVLPQTQRADVSLTNSAKVDVTNKGAGKVGISARNLDITEGSSISAGIAPGLTVDNIAPGDITIDATGTVKVQSSELRNVVNIQATGNAGNIHVSGNRVELSGGGRLRTRTLGKGDAGNINIKAGEISIAHPVYDFPVNSQVDDQPALDASNSGSNENYGSGRSGNISLFADGSIYLSLIRQDREVENERENKIISTYNCCDAKGGGDITLLANGAIFLDNAYLVSSSFSQERGAGSIFINGKESVSIANNSAINAISFSSGNSGNITIQSTGSVLLQTSTVSTNIGSTDLNFLPAQGDAGNIKISSKSVAIADGALVTASTVTSGKAGDIQIDAQELVEIAGTTPFPLPGGYCQGDVTYSSVRTNSEENAKGAGGPIRIIIL